MDYLDRRQFLKKSAITIAVTSTCLCGLNACATFTKIGDTPAINPESFTLKGQTLTIDLEKEPILGKVGGAVKYKDENISRGIIIAHTEVNRFEIVSLLCPHRDVEVEYDHGKKRFECASLGSSTFTFDGKNVGGPAEEPLKKYAYLLQGGILTIEI